MVSKFFTYASLILAFVVTGVNAQAAREILQSYQKSEFEKDLRSFVATRCRVIQIGSYNSDLEFVLDDAGDTIRARVDSYDKVAKVYFGYGANRTLFEVTPLYRNKIMVYLNVDQYSFKPDSSRASGVRRDLIDRMTCGAAKTN